MREIDRLALRVYGKRWRELTREEQNELKRRPEWISAAYGTDKESSQRIIHIQSKELF